MKKISIIIPCYNAASYIDRCLSSLEKQTIGMDALEIICINDCSTDSTLGKLMSWEARYPNSICIIPLQQKVMQGAARNLAIDYATGEYVAYLDADDWILPSAFEKLYRIAKQNGAQMVNYLSKEATEYDPNDNETKSDKPDKMLVVSNKEERMHMLTFEDTQRGCWDKMYTREFILENNLHYAEGVFDEESLFTIDAYFAVERYYFLNEYLHRYFQNPSGTCYSWAQRIDHRDDNAKTWYELYWILREKGYLEDYYHIIEILFIQNYFVRSFMFSFQRGLSYDVKTVNDMQDVVHRLFPNYLQNPLIQQSDVLAEPLPLIDEHVDESNIDDYNERWRIISYKGEPD